MWKANLVKEARAQRGLVLDWLVVALVAVTVFSGDSPVGCALFAIPFAAALAARIGGDETVHGTWEFVLTRPIDRAGWVQTRFLIGFLPVAVAIAFFGLADAADLHARFGRLLAESGPGFRPPSLDPVLYLLAGGVALLVYSITWLNAVRETRPERVHGHAWTGAFAGAFLCWLLAYAISLFFGGPIRGDFLQEGSRAAGRLPFLLALLVGSGLMFLAARRSFVRHEVPGPGDAAAARRGSGVWIGLVIVVLVVLALFTILFLSARPGRP